MPTKNYSIRFDPDLMARVDARPEGRSEFIRAAAEAALGVPFAGAVNGPVAGGKKNLLCRPILILFRLRLIRLRLVQLLRVLVVKLMRPSFWR